MKSSTIAIVGGGAAGVSVFAQLVEKLTLSKDKEASIILIEKDKRVGPGMPYGTISHESILNMRYQKMSIMPNNPNHVSEWLRDNRGTWEAKYPDFDLEADAYPPRSLYAFYLEGVLAEHLAKAASFGINCKVLHDSIVALECADDVVSLSTERGEHITANKVVLALGNYPSTTYQDLKDKPGYFESFWPDGNTMAAIPKDATVCILGTRLTAIDAALTLLGETGNMRKAIIASRSGLLPKVQSISLDPTYQQDLLDEVEENSFQNIISLKQLASIFKEKIESACGHKIDWNPILHPMGLPAEILRKDIEEAKSGESSCWQSVLASTSNVIEEFWRKLPSEDKQEFIGKYGSIWFVYRHAMPLKNAEKVLSYLDEGRIEVRGGILSAAFDEAKNKFTLSFEDGSSLGTSFLINATEAGLDIAKINSPLIKTMLDSGIIRANPFGGIDVDFESCRIIGKDNKLSGSLYSLGYLTRGVHFYTNDVARIAEYARRVVNSLT